MSGPHVDAIHEISQLADGVGLKYAVLPATSLAAGLAFPWDGYTVVASTSLGNVQSLYLTVGVGKSLDHARRSDILEATNDQVAGNPQYPVFMHDAEGGISVLIQLLMPVQLFRDIPPLLQFWQSGMGDIRTQMQERLAARGISFQALSQDPDSILHVYQRSVV